MLTIVWFARDLRLADNPALTAAIARGGSVLPLFILDDADAGQWRPGAASRWWLHQSLVALSTDLRDRGARLVCRSGRAEELLATLIAETSADAVYWSRRYEPWAVARDARIEASLNGQGINVRTFNASLLHDPGTLVNASGGPYRVFSAFCRALRASYRSVAPTPAPATIRGTSFDIASEELDAWRLEGDIALSRPAVRQTWIAGEASAHARLDEFLGDAISSYHERRNEPGTDGTSRLSPHLHFGEIGPRQIWWNVTGRAVGDRGLTASPGAEAYLSEIAWREFSYHLLFKFPAVPESPLREEFARFPWSRSRIRLARWQRGVTGYPIVDAGMRQLWATGWMHNRVRMIVASFLLKDLMIDWREGQRWFHDTLVDADLANNAASWQWVAGSGADAAPYFRVFNPVSQGRKFDPVGSYIRRWIPELAALPNAVIHNPWEASRDELRAAHIEPGVTYPARIVDHAAARDRALDAFHALKRSP